MLFLASGAIAQSSTSAPDDDQSDAKIEAQLSQMLVGKYVYLRGGYLDDSLSFSNRGHLIGISPRGSYTLSVIRIESLHLSRHKLELKGVRYGLHFPGIVSTADSGNVIERVRVTPRKKWVRITIARMKVVKLRIKPKEAKNTPILQLPGATIAFSDAYAAEALRQALGDIFAFNVDSRLVAAMPPFWRRYYQAAEAKTAPDSNAPGVLLISEVDRTPRLLTPLEAPSNEYAQSCGIAGVAIYTAVVSTDGTPEDITIARPIGFGLDENAVAAIHNARFEPGTKDGKAVPVRLDLVVEFRIYSKRTEPGGPASAAAPATSPLPGPYSAEHQ
ncbi:MAG TPA: energy transducer TonB [Terracidiphilus sp.]|nr:energy transducer TonB [Terracidiphilus sp.]